jgi:hypothetical protein
VRDFFTLREGVFPVRGLAGGSSPSATVSCSVPSNTTPYAYSLSLDGSSIKNCSGSTTLSGKPLLTDPREHKRHRERDRYAQLSDLKRKKILKKCHEYSASKRTIANLIDKEHQMELGQYVMEKLQ